METQVANPTVCFVEGFKLKTRVENLERHLQALWQLEQRTASPLEVEALTDLVSDIRHQLRDIAEVDGCVSPELKGAIQYNTARIGDELINFFGKRNWGSVNSHLDELGRVMERWTPAIV